MPNRSKTIRRVSVIVVALAVIGIGAAKAVDDLTPRSWTTGTLTGTLQAVGGPQGASSRPLSGTITATTSNGGILTVPVGADGRFTAHPVVETYTVSARSPQYERGTADCHALGPVTVTKGVTTRVQVDCGSSRG
jgi:hypothetical protein